MSFLNRESRQASITACWPYAKSCCAPERPPPVCYDNHVSCIARWEAYGHKVLLFGNGGSAADAQHLAAEFVGRFQMELFGK